MDRPTDENNMPLAYSYIRYSSRGQLKGDSLRRQTELSDKFALDHGLRIVKNQAYRDLGVSGLKGKNKTEGDLGRFLEDVNKGKIRPGSVLIVESLDRISREKPRVALPWFLNLLNAGIKIATVVDRKIYDPENFSDYDLMGSLFIMSRANDESETKSIRVKQAWQKRRTKGVKGAVCPSWLRLDADTNTYKPIEQRVKVIEDIFNWTIGGIGTFTIARKLNDAAVPLFDNVVSRRRDKRQGWHPTTVYNILNNRALLGFHQAYEIVEGEQRPVGDEVAGYYPAVISEEMWLKAQAKRKKQTGGRRSLYVNLLGEKAHCSACQGPMKIRTNAVAKGRKDYGTVYRYLICSNADKKVGCSGREQFNYDEVEDAILNHVPEYKLSEIFANPASDTELRQTEKELAEVAFKLGEAEKRRTNVRNRLASLADDDELRDDYETMLREIRSELATLNDRLTGLQELRAELAAEQDDRGDMEETVRNLRTAMETAEGDARREIRAKLASAVQSFVDTAQFDPETGIIDVILMGGMVAHRFQKAAPSGRARARKIEYVGSANVAQIMGEHMVPEAFTFGNPERLETLRQLAPTAVKNSINSIT